MRHSAGHRPGRSLRFVVVGLILVVVGFVAFAALFDSASPVEEAVVTADVTPTPQPEPTARAAPTASPVPDPTAVPEVETLEIVNTGGDMAEGTEVLVSEYFVPNFVGAVDRSRYDANVSASLETPTPAPTPTPHFHPDPTAVPAPTSEPTPEPTAAPAADPDPTPEPEQTPTPASDDGDTGSGGPTAAQWASLRQCESGGNYSIVSANGLYRGAYQFSQGTWDSTASGAWPDLVGVNPAQASPADQDKMAFRLYDLRGPGPWPVCGQYLV